MNPFEIPLRLYFADTDLMGIAYHANYYAYFERARTEWFRHHGIDILALDQVEHTGFVLRKSNIDWYAPMSLNDHGVVTVAVEKLGNASVELRQTVDIVQPTGERHNACTANLTIVCVDTQKLRPKAIPERLRELFATILLTP